jgi:hypothetical protein
MKELGWDTYHTAWRRVEAAARTKAAETGARRPIFDVLEQLVARGQLERTVASELDGYRKLRNIDSHEGVAGTGTRLCEPTRDAIERLSAIADMLECATKATAVMTKARTCPATTPLRDVIDWFANGEPVVYYRDKNTWYAFDRSCMSRIVETGRRANSVSLDLTRTLADWAGRGGRLTTTRLDVDATAKNAVDALRAVITCGDDTQMTSILIVDGRTAWHLLPAGIPAAIARIA